jgi:hypothetical protein
MTICILLDNGKSNFRGSKEKLITVNYDKFDHISEILPW